MINIDYKLFHWPRRCGPTSTPNGSASGNMWTTSSISSCQEVSSRCTRWCDSHRSSVAHCRRLKKKRQLCSCSSSQVTFTRTRYHEAVKRWHWQDKVRHSPWNFFHLISPACHTCFSRLLHIPGELFYVTVKSCSNDQPKYLMQMCLSLGNPPPPLNKTLVTLQQTSLRCSGWAGKFLALCWTFPSRPMAVAFALMFSTQRHCWFFHSLSLVNWSAGMSRQRAKWPLLCKETAQPALLNNW